MNKAMGLPVDSSVDLDYAPVAAGSHGLSMDKEAQRSPKRRRKSSDTVSDEQDIRPSTSVQDAPHLVGLEGRGKQQSMNGNVASVVSGELSSRGNEGPVDREDCDADHMKEERHAGGEHGQGEVLVDEYELSDRCLFCSKTEKAPPSENVVSCYSQCTNTSSQYDLDLIIVAG